MAPEQRVRRVTIDRRVNLALRFCMTSWLAIFRWVLLLGLMVCFAGALVTKDMNWLIASGVVGILFVVVLISFMIEAPNVRCLMCGAVMLRPLKCSKHVTAKKWLGSYILRSTCVLATFPKTMHCPYCGGHYKLSRSSRREEADTAGKIRKVKRHTGEKKPTRLPKR
jgi:hypothetical protein